MDQKWFSPPALPIPSEENEHIYYSIYMAMGDIDDEDRHTYYRYYFPGPRSPQPHDEDFGQDLLEIEPHDDNQISSENIESNQEVLNENIDIYDDIEENDTSFAELEEGFGDAEESFEIETPVFKNDVNQTDGNIEKTSVVVSAAENSNDSGMFDLLYNDDSKDDQVADHDDMS